MVSQNILIRMNELGMTKTDLAKAAGITRQTISRIINGRQDNIRQSNLEAIAAALETSAEALKGQDRAELRELLLVRQKLDHIEASIDKQSHEETIRLKMRLSELEAQYRILHALLLQVSPALTTDTFIMKLKDLPLDLKKVVLTIVTQDPSLAIDLPGDYTKCINTFLAAAPSSRD